MYSNEDFEILENLASGAKEELEDQYGDIYREMREVSDEIEGNFDNKKNINPKIDTTNNNIYDETLDSRYDYKEDNQLNKYDEELFEGGPTKLQIDTWKKQFSNYTIFLSEVSGYTFVFRTVNRYEYKQLIAMQNIDGLLREEIICKESVLWPNIDFEDLANVMAGIPSTLAEIIMEKSGFTKEYHIQEI